jgi:hypothetical protein
MAKLNLSRAALAEIARGNAQSIAALARVFNDVGDTFPSTIEEANALAGAALAAAQSAQAGLALLADALARVDAAPASVPQVDVDDTSPRAHLGTIAAQNADSVEVTGGAVDGTPVGTATPAAARFTTVGVGTLTPVYRFVVSNGGAAGVEVDSDGVAFGAGTTGILAYDRAGAAYVPLTLAASSVSLRATNTTRISVNSNGIGFFGTAPIAKPNVAGSWAGNAAGASLAAALGALGLITNSTTA